MNTSNPAGALFGGRVGMGRMADWQAWWQVEEGAFVKEHFDELCWTLTAKKNYRADSNGNSMLSNQDAFRLWCLFNFLSEDKYPLIMVPDEVRVMADPGTESLGAGPRQHHEGSQITFCTLPLPLSSLSPHAGTRPHSAAVSRYLELPMLEQLCLLPEPKVHFSQGSDSPHRRENGLQTSLNRSV